MFTTAEALKGQHAGEATQGLGGAVGSRFEARAGLNGHDVVSGRQVLEYAQRVCAAQVVALLLKVRQRSEFVVLVHVIDPLSYEQPKRAVHRRVPWLVWEEHVEVVLEHVSCHWQKGDAPHALAPVNTEQYRE